MNKPDAKTRTRPQGWQRHLSRLLDLLAGRLGRMCLSLSIWLVGGLSAWVILKVFSWQGTRGVLVDLCTCFGIKPIGPQADFLISLLANHVSMIIGLLVAFMVRFAVRPTTLIALLRRRLIPLNVGLQSDDLERFRNYFLNAAAGRITNLLPDELLPMWDSNTLGKATKLRHSRLLLRPSCSEKRDASNNASPMEISDIWRYLDEYLLDTGTAVAPLMVHGEPGAGKSMLLYHFFGERAVQLLNFRSGWIPLLIFAHELKEPDFRQGITLQEFLACYFGDAHKRNPNLGYEDVGKLIEQRYHEKQFLIIVDGLDELPERNSYFQIIGKLQGLIKQDNDIKGKERHPNRFIVSCRTEDSPDNFQGRLIEIHHLTFAQSRAYLQGLVKFFSGGQFRNPGREARARNALAGLEVSAEQSLLRNYMKNPYLLSLVSEYYEEGGAPRADWLKNVFHKVLARELGKAQQQSATLSRKASPPQPPRPESEETSLSVRYLEKVIGPFCFERTYNTGKNDAAAMALAKPVAQAIFFEQALRRGLGVGIHLFGQRGAKGALALYHQDPSSTDANEQLVEATRGLKSASGESFLDQLKRLRIERNTEQFEHEACELFRRNALRLLSDARLAEVVNPNGPNPRLERFRHRRMGEYFAAKCLDGNSVALDLIAADLKSGWIREPLRMFAAVADDPVPLLDACMNRCQQLSGKLREEVDVLMNAAAAIEYLPRRRDVAEEFQQQLQKSVLRVGEKALEVISICVSQPDNKKVLEDCLAAVKLVYTAECWSGLKKAEKEAIFRSNDAIAKLSRGIRDVVRRVVVQSSHEQVEAYRQLWPLKASLPPLKISRLELFGLIVHEAPFFWDAYRYTVKNTHPDRRSRLPAWGTALLARLLSVASLVGVGWWVWHSFGPLLSIKLIAVGAFVVVMLLLAALAQWWKLMDFKEGWKLIPWGGVCGVKKTWVWFISPRQKFPVEPEKTKVESSTAAPVTGTRPYIPPVGATKRQWAKTALTACSVGVLVLLVWSAWRWGVPFVQTLAAQHDIKLVRKQAAEAKEQHMALSAKLRGLGETPSEADLRQLSKEEEAHAERLDELAKKIQDVCAAAGEAGVKDQSLDSVIDTLGSQAKEARADAATVDNKIFALLRMESTLELLKKIRDECSQLLNDGARLVAEKGNPQTDAQAESRLNACEGWESKVGDVRWKFRYLEIPESVPDSQVKAVTNVLAKLADTETAVSLLMTDYRKQLAPNQERTRIHASMETTRKLVAEGKQLATELMQIKGDDLTQLSKHDDTVSQWLENVRYAKNNLENAKTDLLLPQMAQEASQTAKDLKETEDNISKLREPLQARLRQLRSQQTLRGITELLQKGKALLVHPITETTETALESSEAEISQWLEEAKRIDSVELSNENDPQESRLVQELAELSIQLRTKQNQIAEKLARAVEKAEAAKAAADKRVALQDEATGLLEGKEWNGLVSDLQQFDTPLTKDEETLSRVAAVVNDNQRSLDAVKDGLKFLDNLENRSTRLKAAQSALDDYGRRIEQLISRVESTDAETMSKLRSRREGVQKFMKRMESFGTWCAANPTSDLRGRLKKIEERMEAALAQAQQESSNVKMLISATVILGLLAGLIWYPYSNLRGKIRLGKLGDNLDSLEKFLGEGWPLDVALRTAARMEAAARGQLRAIQNRDSRRTKTDELCTRFEAIQKNLCRNSIGYNAERIARRLQQIIDGLNNERNR
jgi:hypothetical protein